MSRPSYASIDLDALRANYAVARKMHGGRVLAVLKADAYGHGAVACAQALAGQADGYAVAFTDEALVLRQAGIDGPILVLEGAFDADETRTALRQGLWLVVHRADQIAWIAQAAAAGDLAVTASAAKAAGIATSRESTEADPGTHVWLKVDSGMHRAGFLGDEVRTAYRALRAIPAVSEVTLMTHFARADEPHSDMTIAQVRAFDTATAGLAGSRSLCNSAGLIGWPDARHDWARAGIMLYGVDPLPASDAGLRPVMTLRSEIIGVRQLGADEPVGYGAVFLTQRPTRVGLVAMGYADGYPRNAPNGTPVAIDGRPGRLIGRVSMDMLTVDLTEHPDAGIGSSVELWGAQVPVSDVARAAGTIAYELLSNVKRAKRVYERA